jgi:type IV pilus assembly protein PilV
LGAAALQLNALKYTDSSALRTQASFIAYDMMDRIRANPTGAYNVDNMGALPPGDTSPVIAMQDLMDFNKAITAIGGRDPISIKLTDRTRYTITITWDDTRAVRTVTASGRSSNDAVTQTFVLTSRVGAAGVEPQ